MAIFNRYATFYDLLYADKNYQKEAAYVHGLVQRYDVSAKNILEFGCGTGRHARAFAEHGYAVHGIDLSDEMLQAAAMESKGHPLRDMLAFSQADVRTVDLAKSFDVVVSLFHVMSYQITNDDLYKTLMSAHKHLKPGGLLIFDCWYGPAVLSEGCSVRVKRCEDDKFSVVRIAEPHAYPSENRIDVHFTMYIRDKASGQIEVLEEVHPMRYLFRPEMAYLFAQTGFKLLALEAWLTGNDPDTTSWNTCFVGQKL